MVAHRMGVVRLVGVLARGADARLAYGAARNAASCVRDHQAQRLDDARLMHELAPTPVAAADRRRAGER